MSYLTEKRTLLSRRATALFGQREQVPTKFKDRHPKERARIQRAIERDICHVQHEQQQVADALRGG